MPLLLSREEAEALTFIIERAPHVSHDEIAPQVLDALFARGYVHWVGGMLAATSAGILALGRPIKIPS